MKFDIVFSAKGDLRDNFVLWLAGIRRRVGYGLLGGGFLLTDVVTPNISRPRVSERWLQLLHHLGKSAVDRHPHLKLKSEEKEFGWAYLSERGVNEDDVVIGIHPGARITTRQWGAHNFGAVGESLINEFRVKVLWFHDPREDPPERIPEDFIPVSLPLRQFMAVLANCKLLICNDSGPMHIAGGLNVPVVAVFGPTEPSWWAPLGSRNRIVVRKTFWCRPCADRCIFDQPYCLRTISVEEVLRAADDIVREMVREQPLSEERRPQTTALT